MGDAFSVERAGQIEKRRLDSHLLVHETEEGRQSAEAEGGGVAAKRVGRLRPHGQAAGPERRPAAPQERAPARLQGAEIPGTGAARGVVSLRQHRDVAQRGASQQFQARHAAIGSEMAYERCNEATRFTAMCIPDSVPSSPWQSVCLNTR